MKIVNLVAENFKVLQAVDITPAGDVVIVGGKNGSGKTSVLDAIYVALVGRSVAPPKPIRKGEEQCVLKLDLGDFTVTRKFTEAEGGTYTDTIKVEDAEGRRYTKPQQVLDALLGEIGFDPFEFVQMKPKEQADTLLGMVPLPVDLDELAELDASDYAKRRDINRDAAALEANLRAIPKEDVPSGLPDRQALVDQLGTAAETNSAIERDRMGREALTGDIARLISAAEEGEARAKELRAQADELDRNAKVRRDSAAQQQKEFDSLPPLAEPVNTEAIREQLQLADAVLAAAERQKRRADLEAQHGKLTKESEALTAAMEKRAKDRNEALAKAKMPIDGLAFGLDEKGRPAVEFGGVPLEQASSAEQLRASVAIGMAANPSLRVLRVKDGSLLDEDSMKLLSEMAKAEDFQLWIEVVGTGGVGIVMEDGTVKAAPGAKPAAKAKKAAKAEGALL